MARCCSGRHVGSAGPSPGGGVYLPYTFQEASQPAVRKLMSAAAGRGRRGRWPAAGRRAACSAPMLRSDAVHPCKRSPARIPRLMAVALPSARQVAQGRARVLQRRRGETWFASARHCSHGAGCGVAGKEQGIDGEGIPAGRGGDCQIVECVAAAYGLGICRRGRWRRSVACAAAAAGSRVGWLAPFPRRGARGRRPVYSTQ